MIKQREAVRLPSGSGETATTVDLFPVAHKGSDMTIKVIRRVQVGLSEANQHFSRIMQRVRAGEEVVLTERGEPFARIVSIRYRRQEAAIRQMVKEGLLRPAEKPGIMP